MYRRDIARKAYIHRLIKITVCMLKLKLKFYLKNIIQIHQQQSTKPTSFARTCWKKLSTQHAMNLITLIKIKLK
jgi:hypothetical protein